MGQALIKPTALKAGDTIRLVSPASPVAPEKIEPFLKLAEEAGYRIEISDHAFDSDFFLAGSDADRATDLQVAFADDSVAAVLCTRGGYGCARLIPYLDLDAIAKSGKMFLGFSDITTLHLALNRRGLATVHSPMALTLSFDREPWVYESFFAVLRGDAPIPKNLGFEVANPSGEIENQKSKIQIGRLNGGQGEGAVTGGCLCLLTDSIGTSDPLDAEGKIVLIEDVDENPHRIDAMLTHLLLTNALQRAAGIVVGEMTRTDEKVDETIGAKPWRDIVRDRLGSLNVPTITDFPFGHCKNMLSLPLGIRARLDADAGTLTYLEPLCD